MLATASRAEERALLVDAFTRAAATEGYDDVTVEQVARYAGRSPDDFFGHFDGLDQCLLAALERFLERLYEEMEGAFMEERGEWPLRMKAAIEAAVGFAMELDSASRLYLIELSGPAATELRLEMVHQIARALRPARDLYPVAADYPEIMEETLVAGVVLVISGALLEETSSIPAKLSEELVELVLTPYVGRKEAHAVATHPQE